MFSRGLRKPLWLSPSPLKVSSDSRLRLLLAAPLRIALPQQPPGVPPLGGSAFGLNIHFSSLFLVFLCARNRFSRAALLTREEPPTFTTPGSLANFAITV